jgi:hypothetical protein
MDFEFGGKFLIYAMADPRTEELRYVGKSCSGLRRQRQHLCPSTLQSKPKTYCSAWIKSIFLQGHRVSMSTRAKLADLRRGKPLTQEHRLKISAGLKENLGARAAR